MFINTGVRQYNLASQLNAASPDDNDGKGPCGHNFKAGTNWGHKEKEGMLERVEGIPRYSDS